MSRLLLVGLLAALSLSAAPAAAATNECRALKVCVPVAGPWVVVPSSHSVPRPQVQFQLSCPKGYIVGGTDAELSDRAIDIQFLAAVGAPVNPGISTSRDIVFAGTYVGAAPRFPSFRPHIGCIPSRGGGARTPTAVVVPPGKPVVRRVTTQTLYPGRRVIAAVCAGGERLVDAKSAVAFDRVLPPDATLAGAVSVRQTIHGDRTTAKVTTRKVPKYTTAIVQVAAVCAGGR